MIHLAWRLIHPIMAEHELWCLRDLWVIRGPDRGGPNAGLEVWVDGQKTVAHDNTIQGVEALFTADELERGRIIYDNDNQSWLGMLRCVMKVVRGESPDDTVEELREEIEHYEKELSLGRGKMRVYEETLREIAAGRRDAAVAAEQALGGTRFLQTLHSVGERLSRERVWCHVCDKEQELNTYDALNRDEWPQCCARPMGIDSPEERQVEAEKAL